MIVAAGVFNIAVGIFHLAFWRLFGWPAKLAPLDAANRAIIQVLNIALTVAFFVVGAAYLLFPTELVSTNLGRFLMGGMVVFWAVRLAAQPVFFGWTSWVSALFTVLLISGVSLHAAAFLGAIR